MSISTNSVMNGKILKKGMLDEIFVQAAASDAGCSIGFAFYIHNMILNNPEKFFETARIGKEYSQQEKCIVDWRPLSQADSCRV